MRVNGTIGECLDHGYGITAFCPAGHSRALDLDDLARRLGRAHGAMHDDLVPKLRCGRCGRKASAVTCSQITGAQGWPGG